jgi:hypothetical protein
MSVINIGQVAATTLQNYQKTFADNIGLNIVLFNHMKANDMVQLEEGGRNIVMPLEYANSTAVGTYSGTSTVENPYQEGIDAAVYDWVNYYAGISISKDDELKNNGSFAVKKLIKAKIAQAERSLGETIETHMHTGTGGTSALIGTQLLIANNGIVGGISGTTETFWRSYQENSAAPLSISHIRDMVNAIDSLPGKGVSLIETTVTLHAKYESLLTSTLQYNTTTTKEMKRLGDAGFANVGFRGIPVVYNRFVPAGEVYAISPTLKLIQHKDANFDILPMEKVQGQMVYEQYILSTMALVTDNRRKLGKLTAKTV